MFEEGKFNNPENECFNFGIWKNLQICDAGVFRHLSFSALIDFKLCISIIFRRKITNIAPNINLKNLS